MSQATNSGLSFATLDATQPLGVGEAVLVLERCSGSIAVPALSDRGVVVLTLLMSTAAVIAIGRRERARRARPSRRGLLERGPRP